MFDLVDTEMPWNVSYLDRFPYLDHPVSGFDVRSLSVAAERWAVTTITPTMTASRAPRRSVGVGAPVLDIGGDIGALVATMDHTTAGTELFVRPVHDPTTTVHTGVWERELDGREVTAAVFPELREGTYDILDADGGAVDTVEIRGGEVAEIDLRH